ncbi:MAG: acetate--CoA ligase family protein, partial [Candidatus Hydrogenedentes bacterium]|nr:acetate--CoA ligase family protein [Candidatus Hydrogenedentota bacterium]
MNLVARPPLSEHAPRSLDPLFSPKTVAVVGATEKPGSVGRTILWNLISNPFGGTVYAVNPTRHHVLGIKAYPTIRSIEEPVELAVIVTPAQTVPGLIRECVEAGVRGAIVISAGFKEIGAPGVQLEREILEEARRGGVRVVGPNCLGLMNPMTGLNATFASAIARQGSVGFISQSGALCTAILDWSFRAKVGFSAFVSIGSMLDVDWGDLIFYLGDDPNTKSIVIYMETIGDARSFLSAAREVALNKPIIVIKAGQTEAAAKAAASHTGSLAGSDEVLSAAFRRSGVLRVNKISRLFYLADVLGKQPRPKGPRLTILTNAGGPGVLATDALIVDGGQLADVSPETIAELNGILPAHWSHGNPIDILGDAGPDRYAKALEVAARDENSDGLLVVLTPQAMTDPTGTAEKLKVAASNLKKPVLASWMGGADIEAGMSCLAASNIPAFDFPDTAAEVFNSMWRYSYNLRGIYETPALQGDDEANPPDRTTVSRILADARAEGVTILPEHASKQILAAYGIPVVPTAIAATADEAVTLAEEYGYPVVCKLYSKTITHKTDVGGVRLDLNSADAVREAFMAIERSVGEKAGAQHFQGVADQPMIRTEGYEIIVGSSIDAQFGPVLLFGSGGQLVEVYKDRALALPPLNTTLARRMMEQTKIFKALQGVRGRKSVDILALEQLMVRFSHLVVEQRWIKEIDINPLLASADRLIALDARVVLQPPDIREEQLPRLAIRPYPIEHVSNFTLRSGQATTLRPIRPEDEPLMTEFHRTLSNDTVYFRYLGLLALNQRIRHERLTRLCF